MADIDTLAAEALMAAAAAAILIACLGLMRFKERRNIIYARLHIAGIIDVACIFLTLLMSYPLIALTYLLLTPLAAHAIANAHYLRASRESEGQK